MKIKLLCFLLFPLFLFMASPGFSASQPEIPIKDIVTMVDLGAKTCIPCKMMAPILTKLEKEYKGRAAIIFIDVWEHQDQAKKFRVSAIPTQIFYDKDGREIYRHQGFLDEEAIVTQLAKMGVAAPKGN